MPPPEDIAWKFVIRLEGKKKWRCPYCQIDYFGTVTRVKSHLLKQPNKGIALCKRVPEHISTLMNWLHNQVGNKDDIVWKFVDRLEDNKWNCYYCSKEFVGDVPEVKGHLLEAPNEGTSICTEMPDHVRRLMRSLLNEVAEEQSREANGQSSMVPKSGDMPTQAEVAEEESREANIQIGDLLHSDVLFSPASFELVAPFFSTPEGANDIATLTSDQQQGGRQFHPSLTSPSLLQNIHVRPASVPPAPHQSISHDTMNAQQNLTMPLDNLDATQHPDVSNHGWDAAHGNEIASFASQTPMDIDPSIASQRTSDSHIPEAATNTTGPSSSQDMNRGSPIMNVRSICANDEEIRNLKRKVEELDYKEADLKEQMEIESAASSVRKKPRILVEKWLKDTERTRSNIRLIDQANAETLPPKEQVETLTREVEELIKQGLPRTLLMDVRDAKGDPFSERKLTGAAIHRNIKLIWDRLKEDNACKLAIYGMGGVGKTTIMKHIHNRLLKDATFDGVVFITVSQNSSICKLQSDICKALNLGVMEDEHETKRAAMLSQHLERKKNCVLILDDVWHCLDLEEVGIPARAGGIKLVLTTRSLVVCRQMQCQEIKIQSLSQKEAESLFVEELGSEVDLNLETKEVVRSIVDECAGLPLAVITMARSMRGVTDVFEWEDCLVKLKESSMEQTDMQKKVLMNLKFSYDRLGDSDIQQCFLSCAVYPEDAWIGKLELVEFFIDQGLFDRLTTRKKQYDRGLTILNRLENVCLLEASEDWMKMHDLIRDMALHIMSKTSIVEAGKGLTRIPPEEYWTVALEKVSLMKNNIKEFPLDISPNCPKLSTLLLNGHESLEVVVIPDSFFKQLRELKVLNLSGCSLIELPDSISNLVNLRALLLRHCRNLCRIPYLGKLKSLRKLDMVSCFGVEELEGLKELVNLRYLDVIGTSIERIPEGTLGRLLNLQFLRVKTVDAEDITKLGALESFECYFKDVDDFNKCMRVIEQSNNTRYYHVSVRQNEFHVEVNVTDDAIFGNCGRIVEVDEWNDGIVSAGEESTGICILIPQDVQDLTITKGDAKTNFSGMGPLEKLEVLTLRDCQNLGVLWGGQEAEVTNINDSPALTPTPFLFPSLRHLKIYGGPKLKYLFGRGSIINLPHLRKIEIDYCEEMVGIAAAVSLQRSHPLPAFPSLEEITIFLCHKMKSVVESEWLPHFPNLRRIEIDSCDNMEEIIGGPPPYVPIDEISLQSIRVKDCQNMKKLFSHEWLIHLRNLESIELWRCEGMVEIISGAGQGQEGSMINPVNDPASSLQPSISLPELKKLRLEYLPQLKSICEVPLICDSVKRIEVYTCPELKSIPLRLRFRDIDIEDLPYIEVEGEEKWKTLMWDHPNAQAILQPHLHVYDDAYVLNEDKREDDEE